jgi:hypothetical protein
VTILADKDLRGRFGPVRDQDPRPTCMAFAASDAHAATRSPWRELSVEWAYYHALKRDRTAPHAGATMASMLAGIEVDGQPIEVEWPYITELFTDMAVWTPPNAKPLYRRDSASRMATVEGLIERLDADEPVLFTMSISQSFYLPEPNGLVAASEPIEPKRVHAVIAVGHGKHAGDTVILVRNSWGEAWGLKGHAWLTPVYLAPRLLAAATMNGDT